VGTKQIFAKRLAFWGGIAIAAATLQAQVSIQVGDNVTIKNSTPELVGVDGWRFKTTGPITASGWQGVTPTNLTWNGSNYYNLILPKGNYNPGLISTGKSLASNYQWGTKLPACTFPGGSPATDGACDALVSVGSCNEPPAYQDADPITLDQLKEILKNPGYYDEKHRYLDTLGSNGGKFSGGWIDTYYGQTQFQFAIPQGTVSVQTSQTDRFVESKISNLGWMSAAMIQEFFNGDNQWMFAIGFKETNHGLTNHLENPQLAGNYTPFHVEGPTFGDRALSYIKFFPWHSCLANGVPADLTSGLGFCGLGSAYALADIYMGTQATSVAHPHIVNQWIASWVTWDVNYAILANLNTVDFKKVLGESVDRRVGICAMAPIYNVGYWGAGMNVIATLKNTNSVISDPNACNQFPVGNNNYRTSVLTGVKFITDANREAQTNPAIPIVDRYLSIDDVKKFYFGETMQICGDPIKQKGGLMMHFKLPTEQCQAMWSEVEQGFNLQAAKWGGSKISLRYDWLSNMRLAKKFLDFKRPNINAANGDASLIIGANQGTGVGADNKPIDKSYPFVTVQSSDLNSNGDLVVTVNVDDDMGPDNRGIKAMQWTTNDDWSNFQTAGVKRLIPSDTTTLAAKAVYELVIPKATFESWGGQAKNIWLRGVDGCGNSVTRRTTAKGRVLPTLNGAIALTDIPDGKSRRIEVELGDDAAADVKFADVSQVQYTWPTNQDTLTGTFTRVGNKIVVDFAGPLAGSGSGKVILRWSDGATKLSTDVKDGVGPVITSAYYLKETPNEVVVTFSEPVGGLGKSAYYFQNLTQNLAIVPDTVIKLGDGNTWKMVLSTSSVIAKGDSIHIHAPNDTSLVVDIVGNYAKVDNYGVRVVEYTGPATLSKDGNRYEDVNVDGRMDRVVFRFSRAVDAGSLTLMKASIRWKTGAKGVVKSIDLTNLAVSSEDASEVIADLSADPLWKDSISPMTTSFDLSQSQWGEAKLSQALPSGQDTVQLPVMLDAMQPVIATADLRQTSTPQSRPDILALDFSEPLAQEKIKAGNLYRFLIEGTESNLSHSTNLDWRAESRQMRIAFEPSMTQRPSIGDSVRIHFDGPGLGLIEDKAGNMATFQNPNRPITGKMAIRFLIPALALVGETSATEIWGEPMFYLKKDSFPENQLGLGFSFAFADSSKTREERQNVEILYDANIFDQLGGFVAKLQGKLTCMDIEAANPEGILSKACEPGLVGPSREIKVLIPWNYLSQEKRKVGGGAYILIATASSGYKNGKTLLGKQETNNKIGVARVKKDKKSK
jgi:hypothetical protein